MSHNQNQESYDRLYVSLADGVETLQVLIAACNNDRQRYAIIERYETELANQAQCLRVTLNPEEPNFKGAIATVVEQATDQVKSPFIATVLGAEQLKPTALDQFLGYLQWTREGLRALSIPIVLWLPKSLLSTVAERAPDFWSWRNGVFIFGPDDSV